MLQSKANLLLAAAAAAGILAIAGVAAGVATSVSADRTESVIKSPNDRANHHVFAPNDRANHHPKSIVN